MQITFFISVYSIKVGGGCSSTPQILISLFASLVLYTSVVKLDLIKLAIYIIMRSF